MTVDKLRLIGFRNYAELNLEGFSPNLNIICGKNAQGKTNLIEAVHICSNGKSFRTPYDHTTVMDGRDRAYICAGYSEGVIEALIGRDKKKSFKKNGVPLKSAKQLFGALVTVIFSPEDIRTIKESPGLRRSFLDSEISKLRPSYVDALKRYSEIIAQKNAAIRDNKDPAEILRAYNARLKDYIKIITENRAAYAAKLGSLINGAHALISGRDDNIGIEYETQTAPDTADWLERQIKREIAEQGCNYGPHRDDLKFTIDGKDVRQYASQGQLRTLMLAVKTACVNIIEEHSGKKPVLLLDDVFSELDGQRKRNLLKAVGGAQTFITTCEEKLAFLKSGCAVIDVCGGKAEIRG